MWDGIKDGFEVLAHMRLALEKTQDREGRRLWGEAIADLSLELFEAVKKYTAAAREGRENEEREA